ncbi:MAG: hypothetical protein HYX90_00465 [Chloroflexi bacterium]|nr:hypothetical protein [Chloroflexota bacterium]
MRSKITGGIAGGIVAGIIFGFMMQVMKTPDGNPVMGMVANVVRSDSLLVGWIYHLFNSAVIGIIFALFLGKRVHGYPGGAGMGAAYGFAWWILGGLILMPVALGMAPFAPLTVADMRSIGIGSLFGHLIYGMVLGLVFARLYRPRD